jgi:hypothetical protein
MDNLYNGKYAKALCDRFGTEILNSEKDLIPEYRIDKEKQRVSANRNSAYVYSVPEIWKAGHVLALLTNKCNLKCPHCYTFASPETNDYLPLESVTQFSENKYLKDIESISVSGGEVFLYEDLFRFLSRFPISSLVTNGQWAENLNMARDMAGKFYKAVSKTTDYTTRPLDFCLSIDSFHTGENPYRLNRILHVIQAFSELDLNIIFKLFYFNNYKKDHTVELFHRHYHKYVFKSKPKIHFECFDCSYSGRGFFLQNRVNLPKENLNQIYHYRPYIDTGHKYQYVVSADGNIAVYDILNIAPHPLSAGNMLYNDADEIIQNLVSDPIINLIRKIGTKEFLFRMAPKFPLVKKIMAFSHSTQQALYLFMLNSSTMEKVNNYSHELLTKERIRKTA